MRSRRGERECEGIAEGKRSRRRRGSVREEEQEGRGGVRGKSGREGRVVWGEGYLAMRAETEVQSELPELRVKKSMR